MKKLLIFAAIASSAVAFAAPKVFNVSAPTWKKIAVATTDGVNMRKAPSTSAPRLIYDEADIFDFQIPLNYYAKWTTVAPKGTQYAISFSGPAPVVSEKDGWVELLKAGPKCEENAWVSAKYCNIITPAPISYPVKRKLPTYTMIDRGADGIYCVYVSYDEMDSYAEFYVGRLINGIVVAPYKLDCAVANVDDNKKPGIYKNGDNYEFSFTSAMITDYLPDINKMAPAMIEDIINFATKSTTDAIIYQHEDYVTVFE